MRTRKSELADKARRIAMSAAVALGISSISGSALACGMSAMDNGLVAKAVRTLQSDLMVAALSCGGRESYNNFMLSYGPHLSDHDQRLKRHFKSRHGGKHKSALNNYITSLANQGALRMAMTGKRFCTRSIVMHDSLSRGPSDDRLRMIAVAYAASAVPDLARELDEGSRQEGCTAYTVAFESGMGDLIVD